MENHTVGLVRPTAVQLAAAVLISIPLMDILSAQRSGGFMYGIVSWVLVCGAFIVSTFSYFFRYPYLDRRQNWLAPTVERFKVEMPVVVNGDMRLKTVDLSYTGARIAVDAAASFKADQRISVQLTDINDVLCQAKTVAVHDSWIRVYFEDDSANEKELIRQWLLSQNLQKA